MPNGCRQDMTGCQFFFFNDPVPTWPRYGVTSENCTQNMWSISAKKKKKKTQKHPRFNFIGFKMTAENNAEQFGLLHGILLLHRTGRELFGFFLIARKWQCDNSHWPEERGCLHPLFLCRYPDLGEKETLSTHRFISLTEILDYIISLLLFNIWLCKALWEARCLWF